MKAGWMNSLKATSIWILLLWGDWIVNWFTDDNPGLMLPLCAFAMIALLASTKKND